MKKNAEEKPKKKKPSKVLIVILVLFVLYCIGVSDSEPAAEATPSTVPVATEAVAAEEVAAAEILLVPGEQGEYGELITLNADTEFEETYYVYRLPAGTYTVTNVGEYANQFNVYGDTIYQTAEGWDELSDVFYVKLMDVGESDTITIEDHQIIEIHEPGNWKLVETN